MKKYIAEFLGTFALTLAVLGSLIAKGTIPTALVAGLTLAIFVFTIGRISGAHINPAVTIGAWSIKKISIKTGLAYILAQFAGAALAIIALRLANVSLKIPASNPMIGDFLGEFVGMVIFAFGIASVVLSKSDDARTPVLSPFIVGASLSIGATLAVAFGANGVLNPAVAFGIGSFGWAYIVSPILGSIAGMWLYSYLMCDCNNDCEGECVCVSCTQCGDAMVCEVKDQA